MKRALHAKHTPLALFALLALACVACAFPALALAVNGADTEEYGIGDLSSRYGQLDSLGNSLTSEEEVVIETRIGVLTSANRALDGGDVSFQGEIVGDVVKADDGHKWANAIGAANSVISVYMSDEQARSISNEGSYSTTGTSLKITGTYHIACPQHQGELDVHASNVLVVDNGGPTTHVLNTNRLHMSFALCTLALLLLIGFFVARRLREGKAES